MSLARVASRMRLATLASGLAAAVAWPGAAAWAKPVSVQWKPIDEATGYEIQIARDGKIVAGKKLEEPAWSGELEPGVYAYQVRGFDRLKPGEWTTPMPLIVTPKAPETAFPAAGETLTLYSPKLGTTLKWSPVPDIEKFRIQVKRMIETVRDEVVAGTRLALPPLPAGEYTWQITPIMEARGRAPASMKGRAWEGKPGEPMSFRIERGKLEAPSPVSPSGALPPPADGKLKLKWSKVEGAEAYHVEVYKKPSAERAPASDAKPLARVVVADNTAVVSVPAEGHYSWRVRALANIDGATKAPGAAGPTSTADFKLDRNSRYFEGSGYLALSTMLAPYTYEIKSPATGANGSAASSAITVRGSAEYYPSSQWGIGGAFESTSFVIGNDSFMRKGYELVGKYRFSFGDIKRGWAFSPKIGVEARDYFEISSQGGAAVQSSVYGLQAGFDLRKVITQRMSVGIKFAYFKPMMISGDGITELSPEANGRNMSVGAQMLYWLGSSWGLGAGAYVDRRSISYKMTTTPASGAAEEVYMDGTYFFGSLVYSFGR